LKFNLLLAAVLVAAAPVALGAPRNAPPPPSGMVIHLFGPDAGRLEPAAPAGPGEPPPPAAPAAPGATPPGAAPTGAAPAASPAYPQPTLGAALRQLFVTGDPDARRPPNNGPRGHSN
jgi:hypothetical protein